MPHALPTIEIRFPVRYAWGVIVGGVIFFFLGLLLAGKNPGLGAFILFLSLGAVIGANPGLQGYLEKVKASVLGYDIVVPDGELSCTADWFIAECTQRWDAERETKPSGESSVSS